MASSWASSEKGKLVTLTKKFSRSDLHTAKEKDVVVISSSSPSYSEAATPSTKKSSHASENSPIASIETENEKFNSKRQRSTKRSLRLSVFRRKVGSETRGSNDKNNARRTTSLGPNVIKEEPIEKKVKEIPDKKAKNPSSSFPYPKPDTKTKKGFCCSFRQLSRKRLIEPDSTLSVQEPCTILTPEYGPLGISKGNSRNSTAPNSPKPESSIMPTSNSFEQHLLSAVQPSTLPTRRKRFFNPFFFQCCFSIQKC
uniref:Uncharacterized protein n=1 Tax=Panagrolaimus sp. ES5 TaxID=591445 RepID=A0AC34GQJ6_9BILA